MTKLCNWRIRRSISLALATGAAFTPCIVQAQVEQPAAAQISIPSQPMGDALKALAQQGNVDILFRPESTAGLRSEGISGLMSVHEALDRMLRGTGLHYTVTASGAIAVRPSGNAASQGQYGTLSGYVGEEGTSNRLQGAILRIAGTNLTAVTDRQGRYTFGRVPEGYHELTVSYQGKVDAVATVDIEGGAQTNRSFSMVDARAQETTQVIVTATPIRDAQAAAYQRQKASKNLVNVVASDSIGRFPDQNVAEAVSRLPGVAVERDQGQARTVSIRGAPSKWTTLSFNGLNVVSPGGRSPRFDMIPNSIVASIVSTKAVTPDMPAETIAGNVNIITQTAFDRPGLNIAGSAGVGYRELGDGTEYDLNFSVSDTFSDDRFGFVISGARYSRDQVTDNSETRYEFAKEARGTPGEDLIWNRQTDYRYYDLTRSNLAGSARLDFSPSPDHQLFASSIYSEFRDEEQRNLMKPDYDSSLACYAQVSCGNTPEFGTIYGVKMLSNYSYTEAVQAINTNTLGGDHYFDGWDVSWRANYTYSLDRDGGRGSYDMVSSDALSSRPTVYYDGSDPDFLQFYMYETIDNGDGTYSRGDQLAFFPQNELILGNLRIDTERATTNAWSGRVDIAHDLGMAIPAELKFGAAYDTRTKKNRHDRYEADEDSVAAAGLEPVRFARFATDNLFNGEFPKPWDAYRFNADASEALADEVLAKGGAPYSEEDYFEDYYDVTEDIFGGYVMGTFEFGWGSLVTGARAEYIENTGKAFSILNDGDPEMVTAGTDHFGVYPSAHLNWDITDQQKLRVSLNSGVARAGFSTRAPNFTVSDVDEEISGGNPYVLPERTYGADIYYEYYLAPVGILSVGGFYKKVVDPQVGLTTAFGSDVLNAPGYDRASYAFGTTGNGDDGYYYGIELAYAQKFEFLPSLGLPEWTGGFGVDTNLTLADSEITLSNGRQAPMGGTSDMVYNASLYWEDYGLSVRGNWQWRSKWINSYDLDNPELDRYWDGQGRLSFSTRYQVTDGVEWFLNANNLTNAVGRRYVGERTRVYEIERFGRAYTTGLRFNF